MTEYRLNANDLIRTLEAWDDLIGGRGRIHLMACGGTALTLLGYKASTVDVDFLVPKENEYKRLTKFLESTGYEKLSGHRWKRRDEVMVFDLFAGHYVYTTGLLDSPLDEGRHRKIREFKKIYLGVLDPIDLIITKLFRGIEIDFQDCEVLVSKEKINLQALKERYEETAKYETGEIKALRNLELFLKRIKHKG